MVIEQAKNGYILRIDDEEIVVFQSEWGSINHALGALLDYLKKHYENDQDAFKVFVKVDTLSNVSSIK